MSNIDLYIVAIEKLLHKLTGTQRPNIEKAALLIAEAVKNSRWLYVFGSGHSHMMAEEFFYRAGGLVRVYPILEPALMLHESAVKSTSMERLLGYAKILLDDCPIECGDVLIIASNSGRNPVPIEMALEAKKMGIKVIAMTSIKHSKSVNSRHSSGKKLFEIADVVIDNGGVVGDASIKSKSGNVAPTSTVINAAIINAMVARVAEILGDDPHAEFFSSSNTDEGEQLNQKYIDKYKKHVRCL